MSVIDTFLNVMKINGNEEEMDDGYDDGEYLDEPPVERMSKKSVAKETVVSEDKREKPAPAKVSPIRQTRRNSTPGGMELCVIRPTTIEDGREITDTLLDNRAVVLNLEGLDVDIAQRIIDFTSGSCYAISGNLQKISHFIFIITPASVEISGDFQDVLSGAFDVPIQQNNHV